MLRRKERKREDERKGRKVEGKKKDLLSTSMMAWIGRLGLAYAPMCKVDTNGNLL